MKERWFEWLTYSRTEQRGVLALVSLIICLAGINAWWQPGKPLPDIGALPAFARVDSVSADTLEFMDTLLPFDPNGMSREELQRIGVNGRLQKQWLAYLSHGGRFYRDTDLKKLYAMDDDLYERLRPYVHIPRAASNTKSRNKPPSSKERKEPRQPTAIDINVADHAAWITLPGIGEKLSDRIIKYRNLLGGFYSTGQLLEVYGIDSTTWEKMLPFMVVGDTALVQIGLDTAGFKTLLHHPYFSYELVKAVLNERRRKPFENVSELLSRKLVSSELYPKIAPYLNVQHGRKD